ncbi:hypothetical protein HY418_00880 [Candidatus Kaiserbacteria bacterium]|nr:hypothetical protein [Candidatus Kaiserbacteria bacterium]
MKSKYFVIAGLCIAAVVAAYLLFPRQQTNGRLDEFAQCLAEKNITMYGAEWCPHCQSEKKAFGSSFKYVLHVECPDDPKKCIAAGINGYPTWIFPDGKKLEGEQGLSKLSQESGCALPNKQ